MWVPDDLLESMECVGRLQDVRVKGLLKIGSSVINLFPSGTEGRHLFLMFWRANDWQ